MGQSEGGGLATEGALLERERELAALEAFVAGVPDQGPRLMLIEGPAGIGKSSLLGEARRMAEERGIRILGARGGELEREFAFGVVRQLFEPELRSQPVRDEALSGAAEPAAAVFEEVGEGGRDVSFSALHGLYWLTLNLAGEEPLVLAVDDLHWSDHPSLRFLAYLARRLEDLPIAVVAALRPNEPGADVALIAELANDPLSSSSRPGALSEAAVRRVIERHLEREPDESFARACHTATGGNPLLLNELLKTLRDEGAEPVAANTDVVGELGPRAASRAVLLRLARLSAEASEVARAAAILDEGFDVGSLAALADLAPQAAANAAGELSQAEILRSEPPLGFVHPLIRAAVYHDIPPAERQLRHARAAELLDASGAAPERIASHLLAVPPRAEAWVSERLREAGRRAIQKGGADSAAAYLARAVEEPPQPDQRSAALLELGLVESLTNAPAAVEHLRAAYDSLDEPAARALTANALARAMLWSSPPDSASFARAAAQELPDELADLRHTLEALEAAVTWFGVSSPEARERLAPFRDPGRAVGLGGKMMAAVAGWEWAQASGPRERCVELALTSLAGGELMAADNGLLPMYAIATLILADAEEVMDAWEDFTREAYRHGSMFGITTIQLWRGYTLYRRGDLPEAEESLRNRELFEDVYGYGASATVYTISFLAAIRAERGDLAGAREIFARGADPGPADAARYWLATHMTLLLAEGRNEEVLAAADEMPAREPWIVNPTDFYWRSFKAEALDRLGRTDEAIELLGEELELARGWGAPASAGRVLRVLGTIEREAGIEHLRESIELLERSTTRLELAKALCAYGTALRLARKPTDAREPPARAPEPATVCGADPLAERARAELHASGARPRREALSGVGSLTPSERRVADLAAEGLTNRDIAQELYVTPKTVEVHLSNAYRKLEIGSRRELAGALAT